MIKHYRSEYPNQAHQLTVSVSKHYYVTKTGILKYQKKKQEVTLDRFTDSERVHVIHYVIRDHFSGLFYAELGLSDNIIPVQNFLYRAWAEQNDYSFYGVPEFLTIPSTVATVFPELEKHVSALGVKPLKVTSGFQGGIRDIKTIEEYLIISAGSPIKRPKLQIKEICEIVNRQKSRNGKDTKMELWRHNVKPVTIPKSQWPKTFRGDDDF